MKYKQPVKKIDTEETPQGEAAPLTKESGTVKHLYKKVLDWLHEAYDWRFNSIKQYTEFKEKNSDTWQMYDAGRTLNSIYLKMSFEAEFPKSVNQGTLDLLIESSFTPPHNAIQEYFKNLKKPGAKDYIQELTNCLKITPMVINPNLSLQQAFTPLFRRWLIASVQCMLAEKPRSLNGVMLLLIGTQGKYKTTFLSHLCPKVLKGDYYFEGKLDLQNGRNDNLNLLAEMAFINIDDQLGSIFGRDYDTIKSFITQDVVTNRKAYARNTKTRRRIANIVGSVNNDSLFRDVQNRRYLTAQVDDINLTALQKINIDNVWAQAYDLYLKGERAFFDKADEAVINDINNKFLQPTPEEEFLNKLYEPVAVDEPGTEYEMTTEILKALRIYSGLNVYQNTLIDALKRSGFVRISKRIGNTGGPRYVYMVKRKFFYEDNGKIKLSA